MLFFLLAYFPTYLSTPSRIDPFQAKGCRRRPNLALIFLGSFYVALYFVTDAGLLMLCVLSVFQYLLSQEIGWEQHLRNDLCKTLSNNSVCW